MGLIGKKKRKKKGKKPERMGAAKSKIDERKEAKQRSLAAELKKQIELEANATYYEKKWTAWERLGGICVLLRDTSKTEYKVDFAFAADERKPERKPEPIGQLTKFETIATTESTVKVWHEYTWPSPTGLLAPLGGIWKLTRFEATVSFPDKLRSKSSQTGDYAKHESAILPGLGSTYTLKRAFAKEGPNQDSILARMNWNTLTNRILSKLRSKKFDSQRRKDRKPYLTRFQTWWRTLTPAQKTFFATPESTAAVMVAYIKEVFLAALRLALKSAYVRK